MKFYLKTFVLFLMMSVFVSQKVIAQRNYLSEECQKEASEFYDKRKISFNDFKILNDEYVPLPTILKRKGTEQVDVKAVAVTDHKTQNFYGLQYNWKDQSIIDCRSWYHAPMISLIETYKYYTPFIMKELNAIKISTHNLVNCGSPCNYAEVNSVYIIDDISYHPLTQTELSTITYEYPSKMFIDYLTLEEVYQFMITGDGFEDFDWRGKEYRTEELKVKFDKK